MPTHPALLEMKRALKDNPEILDELEMPTTAAMSPLVEGERGKGEVPLFWANWAGSPQKPEYRRLGLAESFNRSLDSTLESQSLRSKTYQAPGTQGSMSSDARITRLLEIVRSLAHMYDVVTGAESQDEAIHALL